MAFGLAKILILSLFAEWLFRNMRLPGFVGIFCVGFILGPSAGNLLPTDFLLLSADLRLIALVIILLRAGFSIHLQNVKKFGIRLILLALVPSLFEQVTVAWLAHAWLGFPLLQAWILGCILPAVSPAVIIPFMLQCIEEKRGQERSLPQLILTAASLDNILNILMCNVFLSVIGHADAGWQYKLAAVPMALVNGLIGGLFLGVALYRLFEAFNPRATKRSLTILSLALLLVLLERSPGPTPFSGLLASMAMGSIILTRRERIAHEVAAKFGKIWIFAEILLFAVVGADFKPAIALAAGISGIAVIGLGLLARMGGVWAALAGSGFTAGEKGVVAAAWLPKASVQATMGAAPLAAMTAVGMPPGPGEIILALATASILLTAPLGAVLARKAVDRWLPPPGK